ncbi:MAG: hypothetical protein JO344_01770 [Planctomycetaceae bacterium]|nr:hypothetical protein [Planctomycetaceae bacterium]
MDLDNLREDQSNGAMAAQWARLARIEDRLTRLMGEAAALARQADLDDEPWVDTDAKLARLQRVVRALKAGRRQALAAVDQLAAALPEDRKLAEVAARLHRQSAPPPPPDSDGLAGAG